MTEKTDKHWVEELFPPRFGLTFDEILKEELPKDNQSPDSALEDGVKGNDSVFAMLARQISPLDVSAIKNVYHRVWLMMRLKAEEERKRKGEVLDTSQDITTRRVRQHHVATSTADLLLHSEKQDPCIWNSDEINILRSAFQATREENHKLRGTLLETQHQLEELRKKYKQELKENENPTKLLKEAKKANQRLTILTRNLKTEVESATRQIDSLRNQLHEAKNERKSLLKEIHQMRMALDHERLNQKKLELELHSSTQETLREMKIHEENLKMMYDEDIQFLQKTIDELNLELEKEKEAHERTRRGLEHLRQHFSSLSLHDEQTENAVKENQLKKWTY